MRAVPIHDPEGLVLHRAIRATIAMTSGFAFGVGVLDDFAAGLFALFGAFALLGVADFGGETATRTRDYLGLSLIGVVLVALGTAVSEQVVVGAVLLFLVTFAIRMLSVFGGAYAAGGPAALLVFVVAALVPGPVSEIPSRELGWLLAAAASVVLATWLWPVHERRVIRLSIATITDGLAALVRGLVADPLSDADDRQREAAALADQIHALRDRYGRTDTRPAGPTSRDQGLIRLVDQLERSVSFAGRTAPPRSSQEVGPDVAAAVTVVVDDVGLATEVADALERTSAVLRRTVDPTPDAALVACRDEHLAQLDRWVSATLAAGFGAEVVVGRLQQVFTLRVLSHSVLAGETDAVVAAGGQLPADDALPVDVPRSGGPREIANRAVALLAPHLRPSSVVFRNALRAASALAAALVVADLVHAEHGFWVVLGTLAVLKSSAMRTGITAVQAIGGVIIGFAAAAAVMVTVGSDPVVLWALLPLTTFLAVYGPAAIHFVVGQAAFTVLVVVLLNLVQPRAGRPAWCGSSPSRSGPR